MSGWRDGDGRTAADRRKLAQAAERERFGNELRQRPLSVLRGWLGAMFVVVLIAALVLTFR